MASVAGKIKQGFGVASGAGEDSPYPAGSIELQRPFFEKLGLDLSPYFAGTLNVDISPYRFRLVGSDYHFPDVNWIDTIPPETFSFSRCRLSWKSITLATLIYYPHPETKLRHYQGDSLLEILAPKIEGIAYGDSVKLELNPAHINLVKIDTNG